MINLLFIIFKDKKSNMYNICIGVGVVSVMT